MGGGGPPAPPPPPPPPPGAPLGHAPGPTAGPVSPTPRERAAANVRKGLACLESLFPNGVAKCRQTLERSGDLFDVSDESVAQHIAPIFPPPKGGALSDAEFARAYEVVRTTEYDVGYTLEVVQKQINAKRKDCAPGMSGLSAKVVKHCWYHASDEQQSALCLLLSRYGNGLVPRDWTRFYAHCDLLRGVALPKPPPRIGVRPVGVAEILVTIANGILNSASMGVFKSSSGGNLAVGIKGGAEAMGHCIDAALSADPRLVDVAFDVRHAFPSLSRRALVEELIRLITVEGKTALIPVLRNVLAMIRGGMRICFRRSRSSGQIEIEVREGVFQGGPLSSALFAIVNAVIIRRFRSLVALGSSPEEAARLIVVSFADDSHCLARAHLVDLVIASMKQAMSEFTAGCAVEKTTIYTPAREGPDYEILCNVADKYKIEIEGFSLRDAPEHCYGSVACGRAIGTPAFVAKYLESKAAKACALVDTLVHLIEQQEVSLFRRPVETSRQAAFLLIRYCAQARFAYFTRVHPPASTFRIGKRVDDHAYEAIARIMRVNPTDSDLVTTAGPEAENRKNKCFRILLELPTAQGGFGFHPVGGASAHANYLSSFTSCANLVRSFVGKVALLPPDPGIPSNPLLRPFHPNAIAAAVSAALVVRGDLLSHLPPPLPDCPIVDTCLAIINEPSTIEHTGPNELLKEITNGRYEARKDFLFRHGFRTAYQKLQFEEQASPHGSAFLNTIPRPGWNNYIPDHLFSPVFGLRLFLLPLPTYSAPGVRSEVHCAACFATQGRSPVLDGPHALVCKAAAHKSEHDGVRDALEHLLLEFAPKIPQAQLEIVHEPLYSAIYAARIRTQPERVQVASNLKRSLHAKRIVNGDLLVTARPDADANSRNSLLLDFVLTSPDTSLHLEHPDAVIARKLTADSALEEAAASKIARFTIDVDMPPESRVTFKPFPISRHGRLGVEADYAINYLTSLIDSHGASDASIHSTKQRLLDRVSIALQVGVGAKILKCIDLHRRHLPAMEVALAAAQAAQAIVIAGAAQAPATAGALVQGLATGGAAGHGGGGAAPSNA